MIHTTGKEKKRKKGKKTLNTFTQDAPLLKGNAGDDLPLYGVVFLLIPLFL